MKVSGRGVHRLLYSKSLFMPRVALVHQLHPVRWGSTAVAVNGAVTAARPEPGKGPSLVASKRVCRSTPTVAPSRPAWVRVRTIGEARGRQPRTDVSPVEVRTTLPRYRGSTSAVGGQELLHLLRDLLRLGPGLSWLIGIPLAAGRDGELEAFAIRRGLTEAIG